MDKQPSSQGGGTAIKRSFLEVDTKTAGKGGVVNNQLEGVERFFVTGSGNGATTALGDIDTFDAVSPEKNNDATLLKKKSASTPPFSPENQRLRNMYNTSIRGELSKESIGGGMAYSPKSVRSLRPEIRTTMDSRLSELSEFAGSQPSSPNMFDDEAAGFLKTSQISTKDVTKVPIIRAKKNTVGVTRTGTSSNSSSNASIPTSSSLPNAAILAKIAAEAESPTVLGGPNREKILGARQAHFEKLKHVISLRRMVSSNGAAVDQSGKIIKLKRGGVVVETETMGSIQFGIPPETIKDTLDLGMSVPKIFVVPKQRFDVRSGLNMCEVEFPGYYQFFINMSSCKLVCTPDVEQELRPLLEEVLNGPHPEYLYSSSEELFVDPNQPMRTDPLLFRSVPDHVKEIAYFLRPRNGREIKVDSLFEFIHFEKEFAQKYPGLNTIKIGKPKNTSSASSPEEPDMRRIRQDGNNISPERMEDDDQYCCKLGADVVIKDFGTEWVVVEKGFEIARVSYTDIEIPVSNLSKCLPSSYFSPPVFGITVLGSSHGFDRKQLTSGFVLWAHGKGIMVDPPPNATDLLRLQGIPPRLVTAIILTHCHADHDAGTFQKILSEGRIALISTKTIIASFLRKYSRISGFTEAFLCRLFEPKIVFIGEELYYSGAVLKFFYSLHALPCVGFEAKVSGKTFVYSADTYYDPIALDKLREEGILSAQRYEGLMSFPFETSDVILHEAGIPPIHTPVQVLKELPPRVLENLYIIHVSDEVASNSGLKLARAGTEHTIRIIDTTPGFDSAAPIIDVLTQSELFFPSNHHKFSLGLTMARYADYAREERLNSQPDKKDFDFLNIRHGGQSNSSLDGNPLPSTSSIYIGQLMHQSSLHSESFQGSDAMSQTQRTSRSLSTANERFGEPTEYATNSKPPNRHARRSSMDRFQEVDFSIAHAADLLRLSFKVEKKKGELVSAKCGDIDKVLYLIVEGFCQIIEPLPFVGSQNADTESGLSSPSEANSVAVRNSQFSDYDNMIFEDLKRVDEVSKFELKNRTPSPALKPHVTVNSEGSHGTILASGDSFGMVVVNGVRQPRNSEIIALSDVVLLALDEGSLGYMVKVYPRLNDRLLRLNVARTSSLWGYIEMNSCLKKLATFQKSQLMTICHEKNVAAGEKLWEVGKPVSSAFLLAEGSMMFAEMKDIEPFQSGCFLCDVQGLITFRNQVHESGNNSLTKPSPPQGNNRNSKTPYSGGGSVTLVACTSCKVYEIFAKEALVFLERNPGMLVQSYSSMVVE